MGWAQYAGGSVKPVDQTKFGWPEGNCLLAATASILELELDALEDMSSACQRFGIDYGSGDPRWWFAYLDVLRKVGWTAFDVPNGRDEWPAIVPSGYAIASGKSPRDLWHSTVALDGVIVHDPHPSRAGIASVLSWTVLHRLADARC